MVEDIQKTRKTIESLYEPYTDTDAPEIVRQRASIQDEIEIGLGQVYGFNFERRLQYIDEKFEDKIEDIKGAPVTDFRTGPVVVGEFFLDDSVADIENYMGLNKDKTSKETGLSLFVDDMYEVLRSRAEEAREGSDIDKLRVVASAHRLAAVSYHVMSLIQPYWDLNKQRSRILAHSYIREFLDEFPELLVDQALGDEGSVPLSRRPTLGPLRVRSFDSIRNTPEEFARVDLEEGEELEDIGDLIEIVKLMDSGTVPFDTSEDQEWIDWGRRVSALSDKYLEGLATPEPSDSSQILGQLKSLRYTVLKKVLDNPDLSSKVPFALPYRLEGDLKLAMPSVKRKFYLDYLLSAQGSAFLRSYILGERIDTRTFDDKDIESLEHFSRGMLNMTYAQIRKSYKEDSVSALSSIRDDAVGEEFIGPQSKMVDEVFNDSNHQAGESYLRIDKISKAQRRSWESRIIRWARETDKASRMRYLFEVSEHSQNPEDKRYREFEKSLNDAISLIGHSDLLRGMCEVIFDKEDDFDSAQRVRELITDSGVIIVDHKDENFGPNHAVIEIENGVATLHLDYHAMYDLPELFHEMFSWEMERYVSENLMGEVEDKDKQALRERLRSHYPQSHLTGLMGDAIFINYISTLYNTY